MLYPAPRPALPGATPDPCEPAARDAAAAAEPPGGRLIARPGRPRPNLRSTRRDWAARVGHGQPASALPRRLAALYALCGGAHRVTAEAAIAAARGHDEPAEARARRHAALRLDTLREHVRRLWLDWPRGLACDDPRAARSPAGPGPDADATDLAALRRCPLLLAGGPPLPPGAASGGPHGAATAPGASAATVALADWAADEVFGLHPLDWLEHWNADPAGWLADWSAHAPTPAARRLAGCRRDASTLVVEPVPLHAHAHPGEMTRLARHLRDDPGFALAPLWRGHCAETGPWTRLADPLARLDGAPSRLGTAWLRLGARLADLARGVVAGPADPWLEHGALALAPGEGIAWSEMARGLLVHWVRLDPAEAASPGADPRVDDCRVIAPTEWNFHPHGAVAQALAALPTSVRAGRVRLLAAAFDPCVELEIERASNATQTETEARHA